MHHVLYVENILKLSVPLCALIVIYSPKESASLWQPFFSHKTIWGMPYHFVLPVLYQCFTRCASDPTCCQIRARETKLNSHNPVLVEKYCEMSLKGVTIISEQDPKYIFNKIPLLQSQTVIFPELCINIFFHHINPWQPACILHRKKVALFNQVVCTHNFCIHLIIIAEL